MKKVENYLETLKLKKCLFGGIAPKQNCDSRNLYAVRFGTV